MEALGIVMALGNWERLISIYCSILALWYVVKGELWHAIEFVGFGVVCWK